MGITTNIRSSHELLLLIQVFISYCTNDKVDFESERKFLWWSQCFFHVSDANFLVLKTLDHLWNQWKWLLSMIVNVYEFNHVQNEILVSVV